MRFLTTPSLRINSALIILLAIALVLAWSALLPSDDEMVAATEASTPNVVILRTLVSYGELSPHSPIVLRLDLVPQSGDFGDGIAFERMDRLFDDYMYLYDIDFTMIVPAEFSETGKETRQAVPLTAYGLRCSQKEPPAEKHRIYGPKSEQMRDDSPIGEQYRAPNRGKVCLNDYYDLTLPGRYSLTIRRKTDKDLDGVKTVKVNAKWKPEGTIITGSFTVPETEYRHNIIPGAVLRSRTIDLLE